MASAEKKYLENLFKSFLKSKGFRKKGASWRKDVDGFLQIINIQGSAYSKNFYVNLGVYIKDLGTLDWPAEYDCHIRIRLNSYCLNKGVLDLLNFEDYGVDEQPRKGLLNILERDGFPWLEKCCSYIGAKEEYMLPNRIMTGHQRKDLDEYFA